MYQKLLKLDNPSPSCGKKFLCVFYVLQYSCSSSSAKVSVWTIDSLCCYKLSRNIKCVHFQTSVQSELLKFAFKSTLSWMLCVLNQIQISLATLRKMWICGEIFSKLRLLVREHCSHLRKLKPKSNVNEAFFLHQLVLSNNSIFDLDWSDFWILVQSWFQERRLALTRALHIMATSLLQLQLTPMAVGPLSHHTSLSALTRQRCNPLILVSCWLSSRYIQIFSVSVI